MMKKRFLKPLVILMFMVLLTSCQGQRNNDEGATEAINETENEENNDEVEVLEDTINQIEAQIEAYEDEIEGYLEDATADEERIEVLEDQIDTLNEEILSVEELLTASYDEIAQLQDENARLEAQIQDLETAVVVGEIDAVIAKAIMKNYAEEVIAIMDSKDMEAFSAYIHPEKGVRFTQYSHVFVDSDLVFTSEEIAEFESDTTEYMWGLYDGSGEEINLTPMDYYDSFVYDEAYIEADEITYNTIASYTGMEENQFEIYENAIIVEYYFEGFDPEFYGMDWASLRVVYEMYKDDWYIVGIIHSEWTI